MALGKNNPLPNNECKINSKFFFYENNIVLVEN